MKINVRNVGSMNQHTDFIILTENWIKNEENIWIWKWLLSTDAVRVVDKTCRNPQRYNLFKLLKQYVKETFSKCISTI